jgi:putative methyltransferase (TIGR04325 family)
MIAAELKRVAFPVLRGLAETARATLTPLKAAGGRMRYFSPLPRRFTGVYDSYENAFATAMKMSLAGYDHKEVAGIAFDVMCRLAPWDYPVLFWLEKVIPGAGSLVDAGGHMGTKYRAFRAPLELDNEFRWIVYDLPAIVRAGRDRAAADGLPALDFVDRLEDASGTKILLGSGLLQYLDIPFGALMKRLAPLPRHVILNKVALHKRGPLFTLERIGSALVPYQMRDEMALLQEFAMLGYRIADRWTIPSLAHVIDTHPEFGASDSAGYYLQLDA